MFSRIVPLLVAAAVVVPSAGGTAATTQITCAGAINWSAARSAVGRTSTVRGPVADSYYARSSNGSPTFLNLGRKYPDRARFTIVIWGEHRARFGAPEMRYRGRTICVRGRISMYGGAPQIEASSPTQIAIAR